MINKVFVVSDLHKRDIDFKDTKGFKEAVDAVQYDFMTFIERENITHFMSAGDWYDKGYRDVGRTKHDDNLDREISRRVNGEAYICLGNHFFIERDQNPEMYMIQPNSKYKPANAIFSIDPIFKAVDKLVIGCVQFSFFHFDKHNKLYIANREPGIKYHIGIYHDDCVMPSDARKRAGYEVNTSTEYLEQIYANIDVAVIGHVHVAIGNYTLHLNSGKKVPLIIPGACSVTQNKESHKHKEVKLPVFTIDTEAEKMTCSLYPFPIYLEKYKFYEKKESEIIPYEASTNAEKKDLFVVKSVSAREYLTKKGFSGKYIEFYNKALSGPMALTDAIEIMNKEEPDGNNNSGERCSID